MITDLEKKLNGSLPVIREELFELVNSWGRKDEFSTHDDIEINSCEPSECYPLENLDVSQIDDFSKIFYESYFNSNISNWDVSNATNMYCMFSSSEFNNNSLKDWNVSNVENMEFMFYQTKFNADLSGWNISNVLNMVNTFDSCSFDGDISSWKFNENVDCFDIFCDNENFKDIYNINNYYPYQYSKDFLKWFERNREKIKELNQGSKEEVLDFFSFDYNLNKDIK